MHIDFAVANAVIPIEARKCGGRFQEWRAKMIPQAGPALGSLAWSMMMYEKTAIAGV